ncbi:proline-rich transmembrane protein 4-like [Corticium candelabrum]|uniref:proline-rich transmembrane protein 4-like n=1 Tax=Corticium candelabrum TaxID=121492 RepID=UPI002E2528EB|nr:proline-rich transmembrane protein 4-like [Corticium candelabrum]
MERRVRAEPEPESEPEPEPVHYDNHSDCDGALFEPQPEPHPDWSSAMKEWGAAWEVHVYVYAIAFILLALTAAYLLTKRKEGRFKTGYFLTLQVLLLIIGVTRFISLVIDPYGSMDPVALPLPLQRFIFGLALPCLLSSFSLIFLTLVEASKVRFVSRNIMNWKVIGILCLVHFASNVTGDFLISYNIKPKIIGLVCYFYLCLWGLFMFIGFPVVGHKIICNLIHTSRSVKRRARKEPLLKVARLTYCSAMCGVLLLVAQIYFVLDVYGKARRDSSNCHSDPWLWWTFQSIARLGEIIMSILLLYSTYDPNQQSCIRCVLFKSCTIEPKQDVQMERQQNRTFVLSHQQRNGNRAIQQEAQISVDSGVYVTAELTNVAVLKQDDHPSETTVEINDSVGTPQPLLKSSCHHFISYQDVSLCAKKSLSPSRSVSASAVGKPPSPLMRRDTETIEIPFDCDSLSDQE